MKRSLALVMLLVGCSYDWDSVQPSYLRDDAGSSDDDGFVTFDPRQTILPGTSCNPVSMVGCAASNFCLGMIDSSQTFSSLTCHASFGSGIQGSFCANASNCSPGYICWADPMGASSSCEEPCFDDTDCNSGSCDTSGRYASPYGRTTLFRCL